MSSFSGWISGVNDGKSAAFPGCGGIAGSKGAKSGGRGAGCAGRRDRRQGAGGCSRAGEGAAGALEGAQQGVALVGEAGEAGGEELEDAGLGQERVEGALEVEVGVVGKAVGGGEGAHGGELAVEDAGFDRVVAELAPLEGGQLAQHKGLVGVAGLEAVEEGGIEGLELGGVFGVQEGSEARVAAVLEGVQGGAGFSFRSARAAGAAFLAVGVDGIRQERSPPAGDYRAGWTDFPGPFFRGGWEVVWDEEDGGTKKR